MLRVFACILLVAFLSSCQENVTVKDGRLQVVTTTSIITDIVQNIGGEKVSTVGLMGPGIDPHLYKASEGDVLKIAAADLIIYGGLHLEGKLVDVFSKVEHLGKRSLDLGASLPIEQLHASSAFGGNFDPHFWFDINLMVVAVKHIAKTLGELDRENAAFYAQNLASYLKELSVLSNEIEQLLVDLPLAKRHLVTAHDAFGYFGSAYDFRVIGLQGLSTSTEAGVRDIRRVADYIVDNEVSSIFIESSVPVKTIEALQRAVQAKGRRVAIGGMLYSDALGNAGMEEGTYIGMMRYNVKTIVNGLK